MVFYFTSEEGYVIYMGKDKFENEDLIRFGLPEDVWFHVDDLSSAHVYLRLRPGQKLDEVSDATIMECAQLVKANSIDGCKLKSVSVVYTRWRNLHKTGSMEVGAIGFHDQAKVRRVVVERCNPIVNRLNRTKQEQFPDLAEMQERRAAEMRAERRAKVQEEKRQEKQARRKREEEAQLRSYSSLFSETTMESKTDFVATEDQTAAVAYEDEFM